jgi:predicted Zn-dependent protease
VKTAAPAAGRLLLLAAGLLAAACAPVPLARPTAAAKSPTHAAHAEMPVWRLAELAEATHPFISLRAPTGMALMVDAKRMKLMHATAQRVLAAAGGGEAPDWLLVGSPGINAYAAYQRGQPVVGVTLGMVNLLQDDEDAWAALFGHEIAHFRLGHHEAHRTRKQATEFGTSLASIVLSAAGLGFGGVVADATGTLVERSFSRDDESDADRIGLDIQKRAGFAGAGAVRLQQGLLESAQASSPGFLSTHPGGRERIERLRQLLGEPAAPRSREDGAETARFF